MTYTLIVEQRIPMAGGKLIDGGRVGASDRVTLLTWTETYSSKKAYADLLAVAARTYTVKRDPFDRSHIGLACGSRIPRPCISKAKHTFQVTGLDGFSTQYHVCDTHKRYYDQLRNLVERLATSNVSVGEAQS